MAAPRITVTLLIDKEKDRVVYAESGKDFVDILFSFLTLPMGTIVRLLGKHSNLGCFDKLYESVENLETIDLQTEACKTMLLQPISSAEDQCENLAIQVDDTHPSRGFFCRNSDCCRWYQKQWVSTVRNTLCQCGQKMEEEVAIRRKSWFETNCNGLDGNGVFVKGDVRFMISDDLRVVPICTDAANILLDKLGVNNSLMVHEEQMVEFGRDEVLNLLKCSLQSSTPLTDVFMPNSNHNHVLNLEVQAKIQTHIAKEVAAKAVKVNLRLFLTKPEEKIVFGEVGEDFVNLLFSFLVLPVGSIVKKLDGHSSMGSIDNLYRSVDDLNVSDYLISEDCRSMLLSPKLAAYFGCDNQLIKTTEMSLCDSVVYKCSHFCHYIDTLSPIIHKFYCTSKYKSRLSFKWINPKSPEPTKNSGGRYVNGPGKFMVTDEMAVTPFSFSEVMNMVDQLKKSVHDLEEKEVYLGEPEVLAMLRASLITSTALTSTFSPKGKKQFQHLDEEYYKIPSVAVSHDGLLFWPYLGLCWLSEMLLKIVTFLGKGKWFQGDTLF